MIILAVETSCDDTCVALVKAWGKKNPRFKILSSLVSSQIKIHQNWGGVYPNLAKREHQKNLPIVIEKAIKEAKKQRPVLYQVNRDPSSICSRGVDLVAITVGPGLEPCLWVGINLTKDLAKKLKAPIIPVNHIEAHILANWLLPINKCQIFPAICLVVSGGHTQLILMKNFGKYKILGETRDDAAGECFDKVARILGLGYPGGPVIAKQAAKLKTKNYKLKTKLPRPMIYQKNYDFSFSGLKTAVLYNFKSQPKKVRKSKKYIQSICFEVQQAVIDVLIQKTLRAAKEHKAKTIILGGGVIANEELRKQFKNICRKTGFRFLVPSKNLCTDNAAMVAGTAYFHWLKERVSKPKDIEANANQRI